MSERENSGTEGTQIEHAGAILTVASEMKGAADLDRVLDALQERCDRGDRFGVMIVPSGGAPAQQEGGGGHGPAQILRLKSLRSRLKKECAGIAFVLGADARRDLDKRLRAAPKIFGCRVEAFEAREEATAWLRGRLDDEA